MRPATRLASVIRIGLFVDLNQAVSAPGDRTSHVGSPDDLMPRVPFGRCRKNCVRPPASFTRP
jgi:hypothetical protein